MLFSTAGTAGKARLTIAPDGPPGEGSGLQEHIRGETGGRRGPAGRHRAASGGPRRGSGRGRRQGEPEWQAVSPTACRSGPPGPGLPIKKERLVLQQTSNYQLSQWDAEDRIQREDFNGDNAKVDAALKAQSDEITALTSAVALCGNCKIVYGSYTGTGTYGSANPCSLTFEHRPVLVYVQGASKQSSDDKKLRMLRPATWAAGWEGNTYWANTVIWTEKGVKWYNSTQYTSALVQFNTNGEVYYYIAFLAADET